VSETASRSHDLVSIVIPCYKGARFLPAAIESCLQQTYPHLEILVVDDCSPDDCAVIAEDYARKDPRITVIRRSQNGGVSAAFNSGFCVATGAYYTRLAQDDVFAPNAIEVMVHHLEQHPDLGLVYMDYQVIDESGKVIGYAAVPGPDEVLSWRNALGLCVMWRRKVWETVGEFDSAFDTAEDFDYWLRISQRFPIGRCDGHAPLFVRVHAGMGTVCFADRQETATLRVLRRHFQGSRFLTRRWFLQRKALAYALCSNASLYTLSGKQFKALLNILYSFLLWPFPYRPAESLNRHKLFALALLRFFQPYPLFRKSRFTTG